MQSVPRSSCADPANWRPTIFTTKDDIIAWLAEVASLAAKAGTAPTGSSSPPQLSLELLPGVLAAMDAHRDTEEVQQAALWALLNLVWCGDGVFCEVLGDRHTGLARIAAAMDDQRVSPCVLHHACWCLANLATCGSPTVKEEMLAAGIPDRLRRVVAEWSPIDSSEFTASGYAKDALAALSARTKDGESGQAGAPS